MILLSLKLVKTSLCRFLEHESLAEPCEHALCPHHIEPSLEPSEVGTFIAIFQVRILKLIEVRLLFQSLTEIMAVAIFLLASSVSIETDFT